MSEYPEKEIMVIQKKMGELHKLAGQIENMMKTVISSAVLHKELQDITAEYAELASTHRKLILECKAPKLLEKRILKVKRKRGRPRKVAA